MTGPAHASAKTPAPSSTSPRPRTPATAPDTDRQDQLGAQGTYTAKDIAARHGAPGRKHRLTPSPDFSKDPGTAVAPPAVKAPAPAPSAKPDTPAAAAPNSGLRMGKEGKPKPKPAKGAQEASVPPRSAKSDSAAPSAAKPAGATARGGTSAAVAANFRADVTRAGSAVAVPKPDLPQPARDSIAATASAIGQRDAATRSGLHQDAAAGIPAPPETDQKPKPPPKNPVPDHTRAVERASGKRLPLQLPPQLHASRRRTVEGHRFGGTMPDVTLKPVSETVFRALTEPESLRLLATADVDIAADAAVRREFQQFNKIIDPRSRVPGTPPAISADDGPVPPAPVDPGLTIPVGQVVSRLLADVDGTATKVLNRLRASAYPGKILLDTFPQAGSAYLGDIRARASSSLKEIAASANVSAEALDGLVAEQKAQLAQNAAETEAKAKEEKKTLLERVMTEHSSTKEAVHATSDAIYEELVERRASVAGEADFDVVRGRRDHWVKWFRKTVTKEITQYQRAGDKRVAELETLKRAHSDGYLALSQEERAKVLVPDPPRAPVAESDEPRRAFLAGHTLAIREWAAARIKDSDAKFKHSIDTAKSWTKKFRDEIETAGTDGIRAARRWAEKIILEGQDFWVRLLAMVARWLKESTDINEKWTVRRTREHRDQIGEDLKTVQAIHRLVDAGMTSEELKAMKGLTKQQREVIDMLLGAKGSRHPLDIATALLRNEIADEMGPAVREAIERELINTPVGEGDTGTVDNLVKIANAGGGNFDAYARARKIRASVTRILGGTDEDKIARALEGLTPFTSAILAKAYKALYGDNLQDDLEGDLNDDEMRWANAALAGKQARIDAARIYDALTSFDTDEPVVMKTLRNKSNAELTAIRIEFRKIAGKELDTMLRAELDEGNEIDEARALVGGNTARADAIATDEALNGFWGADYDEVRAIQGRAKTEAKGAAAKSMLSAREYDYKRKHHLGRVSEEFEDKYGTEERYLFYGMTGGRGALERAFIKRTGITSSEGFRAAQRGDDEGERAALAELEWRGLWASDDYLNDVILGGSFEDARYETSLDQSPARALIRRARIAKMKTDPAMKYDKVAQHRYLEMLKLLEEREVEQAAIPLAQRNLGRIGGAFYQNTLKDFGTEILDVTSGSGNKEAQLRLASGGFISPEKQLYYAIKGAGTKEEATKIAMQRMTKSELAAFSVWLEQKEGEDLQSFLEGDFSLFDEDDMVLLSQYGRALDPLDKAEYTDKRAKLLRESVGFGSAFADAEETFVIDREKKLQAARLRLLAAMKDQSAAGLEEQSKALRDLLTLTADLDKATEAYEAEIDLVGERVAMVVTIVVAIVVTAASGGTLGGPAAALLTGSSTGLSATGAAMAGAGAATISGVATKAAIKGSTYSSDEIAIDIAAGIADVLSARLTTGMSDKVFGAVFARKLGNNVPEFAGAIKKSGMPRLIVAESAEEAAKTAIKPQFVQRLLANIAEDAVSSIPASVAGSLADERTWDNDPLKHVLKAVVSGTAEGIVMGRGMDLGMTVGASAAEISGNQLRKMVSGADQTGRLREAQELSAQYYREYLRSVEPPGAETPAADATIEGFLGSPHGALLRQDLTRRGLMGDLAAHTGVDAPAAEPAGTARSADPGTATEALVSILPDKLRQGTDFVASPDLPGRTVRVEPQYSGKTMTGIVVRFGPEATQLDIALHAGALRAAKRYQGLMGRLRRALDELTHKIDKNYVKPDTRGWEAKLELEKLPLIVAIEIDKLSRGALLPEVEAELMTTIARLELQIEKHRAVLADPKQRNAKARGYVAAEYSHLPDNHRTSNFPDMIDRIEDAPPSWLDDTTQVDLADAQSEIDALGGPLRTEEIGSLGPEPRTGLFKDDSRGLTEPGRETFRTDREAVTMAYFAYKALSLDPGAASDAEIDRARTEYRSRLAAFADRYGLSDAEAHRSVTHDELPNAVAAMVAGGTLPPPTDLRPSGPTHDELMRARFAALDPGAAVDTRSPQELVDDIARQGTASDAQSKLNEISAAPKTYEVVNVDPDWLLAQVPNSERRWVEIHGVEFQIAGYVPKGQTSPEHVKFFSNFPPHDEVGNRVFQFNNGALRVWRSPPEPGYPEGKLMQETVVGRGGKRQKQEVNQLDTHKDAGMEGPVTERAHAHGVIIGPESPFGIFHAPRQVNQRTQAKGIEAYIQKLRDNAPPGVAYIVTSDVTHQGRGERLAEIGYRIDVVIHGKRMPFGEFAITVKPLPADPGPQSTDAGADAPTPKREVTANEIVRVSRLKLRGIGPSDAFPVDGFSSRQVLPLLEQAVADLQQSVTPSDRVLVERLDVVPDAQKVKEALLLLPPEELQGRIADETPDDLGQLVIDSRDTLPTDDWYDRLSALVYDRKKTQEYFLVDLRQVDWNRTQYDDFFRKLREQVRYPGLSKVIILRDGDGTLTP